MTSQRWARHSASNSSTSSTSLNGKSSNYEKSKSQRDVKASILALEAVYGLL